MNRYPRVASVLELPVRLRRTIPSEWLDYNRHMNVRHYFDLHVATLETVWEEFGVVEAYHASGRGTVFTLDQQILYLAEVRGDEEVTTHARVVARSEKAVSVTTFLVNTTTSQLSSVMHMVGGHIDLRTRRMSAIPEEMSARIDRILAQHDHLAWPAPTSSPTAVR